MPKDTQRAYLVEIAPEPTAAGELATRARRTAGDARFLRSIYVPEDDRWFLLYESACEADVVDAVERADAHLLSLAVADEPAVRRAG